MESQKSVVNVKISRQPIDLTQKIPKNSHLETFKGNLLVSSILPSNKKTVQVIDLESRSVLASFDKQAENNILSLDNVPYSILIHRFSNSDKLILAEDNHLKLLVASPLGTLPLGSALQRNELESTSGSANSMVLVELTVAEAFQLLNSLESNGYDISKEQSKNVVVYNSKQFNFVHDLDGNGIIDYLGVENVTVTSSSISKGSPEKFIEKGEVFCWTHNEPFSWFCVDFGESTSVMPTHYTLRYGSSGDACCPRNWLLQGANELLTDDSYDVDSPSWTTLKIHEDDHSINGSHAYATFPITDVVKSFRYFRIIQTGPNCYDPNGEAEDKWSNVLVASGFEIYGVLKEKTTVQQNVVENVKEFVSHLTKGIESVEKLELTNKQKHWSKITFAMTYSKLKVAFTAISPQIADHPGYSVALSILERLKIHGKSIGDNDAFIETVSTKPKTTPKPEEKNPPPPTTTTPPVAPTNVVKANMNTEFNRLESFKDWPHPLTYFATPATLAQSGFYHEPKPSPTAPAHEVTGLDRCICFSCQLALDSWEKEDDPYEAHMTHSSSCRFIQGKPTANVPLSASLAAFPAKKHSDYAMARVSVIADHPLLDVVVTISNNGDVTVWDSFLNLKSVQNFNFKLLSNLNLDEVNGALLLPFNPPSQTPNQPLKEKFVKWVCLDIHVEVTDAGLYPGAKGRVIDVKSEEEIRIIVFGLNEEMVFPVKHLRALKAKPEQRVKVIQGDLRGRTGVLLSVNKNTAVVRFEDTKEVKNIDFAHVAACGDEDPARLLPPFALFTSSFNSNDKSSNLTLFEFSKGKSKLLNSVSITKYGRVVSLIRGQSDKIYVLCSNPEGDKFVNTLVTFDYISAEAKLNEASSTVLGVNEELIKMIPVQLGVMGESLLTISKKGSLLLIQGETQVNQKLEQEVEEFVFDPLQEQVVLLSPSEELSTITIAQQSGLSENAESSLNLGDITLENIMSLNKLELEPLSFISYPPHEAKQTSINERNGSSTKIKWYVPSSSNSSSLSFQIELPRIQIVDRLAFAVGFNPAQLKDTKGTQHYLTLEYISIDKPGWQTAIDNTDLIKLIHSEHDEKFDDGFDELHTVLINVHLTTKRLQLTIKSAPGLRAVNNLQQMTLSVYGVKSNTRELFLKREKRLALFGVTDFHIQLLQTVQKVNVRGDLRNACMELLHTVWTAKGDISYVHQHFDAMAFIRNNIISTTSATARIGCRLLGLVAQLSPKLKDVVFGSLLDSLEFAADQAVSSTSVDLMFSLISQFWSISAATAHNKCLEVLAYIGKKLYDNRSPFYNILRTNFNLYGLPLETDLFASKSMVDRKDKEVSVVGGDELTVQFTDNSHNAISIDEKKRTVKFSKIYRSGNWIILDLSAPCLVSDININFQSANNAISGVLTIDTWTERESDGSRLISHKIQPMRQKKKKTENKRETFSFGELSRLCRFLKIDIKSFNPSGESGIIIVDIFGVKDFIVPSQPGKDWIPKLKAQIRSAEEKHHVLSSDFVGKRRKLTTLLEEINVNGDIANHESELSNVYSDCILVQAECHKEWEKLRRLRQIEAEISGNFIQDQSLGDAKIDRWTYVADHLCRALTSSSSEKAIQVAKSKLEELFKHYCIFLTPSLRKAVAKIIKKQLNLFPNVWPTFIADTLQAYFSTPKQAQTPLNLFPQNEVYKLLQEIIEQNETRASYTQELFRMLEKLSKDHIMDLGLIAWILSLLANNIEHSTVKAAVHLGTTCDNCGASPITGVRYRCMNCINYELCEQCETKYMATHNNWHLFVKIPKPVASSNNYVAPEAPALPLLYPGKATKEQKKSEGKTEENQNGTANTYSKHVLHNGVVCDGCGGNLNGIRYKCANCDDYDLCESCEEKVEHHPQHVFVKIYHPLPTPSGGNNAPRPFLADVNVISNLTKTVNSPRTPTSERPTTQTLDSGKENRVLPLRSVFSLLLSSWKQPLATAVLLLATKVLEGLAKQSSTIEVLTDVFLNDRFEELIQNAANHNDAFVRHAILHMLDTLTNGETYEHKGQEDLLKIKSVVREKAASLLATLSTETASTFLLELLLVATSTERITVSSEDTPENLQKASNESLPEAKITSSNSASVTSVALGLDRLRPTDDNLQPKLSDSLTEKLLAYLEKSKLSTVPVARNFCSVFRLLVVSSPGLIAKSSALFKSIKSALQAPDDMQVLLQRDFMDLIGHLLEFQNHPTPDFPTNFTANLMTVLVEALPLVKGEETPLLYLTLVSTLRTGNKFDVHHVATLVQFVAAALTESVKSSVLLETKDRKKEKSPLHEVIELLNNILSKPSNEKLCLDLINHEREHGSSFTKILQWLGNEYQPLPTHILRDEVIKLVQVLSTPDIGAKYLASLCLQVVQDKPTTNIEQLLLKLIRNEELAHYVAVDRHGSQYLFKQLSQIPVLPILPKSGITATIISNMASKSAASSSQQKNSNKKSDKSSDFQKGQLENLNPVCKILETDTTLARLIRESGTSSSSHIWSHTFKKDPPEPDFAITIRVPSDVIVKEIQIHAMQNYHISTGNSLFPPFVTIESGNALQRLLPCGRFPCIINKNQVSSGMFTSSFKFSLPSAEVVQYIRLRIAAPEKSPFIALSRIQLRGHFLGNFQEIEETNTTVNQLPLPLALELLSHLLKFDKVQQVIAKDDQIISLSTLLLNILSKDTYNHIHEILFCLAKNNTTLSHKLLDEVLVEGQSSYHASLAGKICSINDSESQKRLEKLQSFVFDQLSRYSFTSFSSQLTPFLNSLSHAISQLHGLQIKVKEEEMILLFNAAVNAMDGSLMEECSLKLLAAIVQSNDSNYQVTIDFVKSKFSKDSIENLITNQSGTFDILGILACASGACAERLLKSGVTDTFLNYMKEVITSKTTSPQTIKTILSFFDYVAHHKIIKDWIGENTFPNLFEICNTPDYLSKLLYSALAVFKSSATLHTENQEKIANHLLQQLTPESISNFMLQLMVEMFAFEEKLTVSLHHLGGEDPLSLTTSSGTQKRGLRFDPEYCDNHIELDDNCLTATCTTTTKWCTVLCGEGFTRGFHKWDVVIDKCTNTCNIMIGVCEKAQNLAYYVGQDSSTNGWAYYGCNGYVFHGGGSKQYGQKLKQGDIITVELDIDSGVISFAKNGSGFGIAYSSGLEGIELFPAVSLYDIGDCVSIVDSKKDPNTGATGLPSIGDYLLSLTSPLRYHRVAPMFELPMRTTVHDLSLKITGDSPDKKTSLKFYLLTKSEKIPLENTKVLSEILLESNNNGEIIDLGFEAVNVTDPVPSPPVNSIASCPILKIFTIKQGLLKLVGLLYGHYRKLIKSEKSDENTRRKRWLRELRAHIQINGFPELFINNSNCRALLFRTMKGRENSEDLVLPKSIVENPSEPIYATLFQLFANKEAIKDTSVLFKELLDSGSLRLLLNRISTLCAVDHRNPAKFDKKKKVKETTPKPKILQKNTDSRQEYWAKGTGFGTSQDDKLPVTWTPADYSKQQEVKAQNTETLFMGINALLSLEGSLPESLMEILADSCLVPALEGYLRNDSILEMARFKQVHIAVLTLVSTIAKKEELTGLVVNDSSIEKLLDKLNTIALVVLKTMASNKLRIQNVKDKEKEKEKEKEVKESESLKEGKKEDKPKEKQEKPVDDEETSVLANLIVATAETVRTQIGIFRHKDKKQQALQKALSETREIVGNVLFEKYKETLQPLQFDELNMSKKGSYSHHYKSRIEKDELGSATSEKVKRLIQEIGSLSTSLPLYPESSVFLRVDSNRIDVMQVIIVGPTGTPYANGCFLFDIYCPPEYPKAPPLVNLQTTGGGSVRFNPNLYNCGKVCLSLLGTWKGSENEKWNAKTSTLLQVLVSIQSLILVEEPYFNEPGYETEIGKPSGIQHSREYNENIRSATIKWAMIEQLKRPPSGFEDVVRFHFKIKRAEVLKQCYDWVKEAHQSKTSGHLDKMKKLYEDLQKELQKLDPDVPLEIPEDVNEIEKKQKQEKEAKRKELVINLQEILPGHPHDLYMKALESNEDKLDAALNWLLEKTTS